LLNVLSKSTQDVQAVDGFAPRQGPSAC
jgi:hypothetical protein